MSENDIATKKDDFINDILRLGFECNEKCVFCNFTPESEPDCHRLTADEAKTFIRRFAESSHRELSISGGEPTLRKDLPELISFARGLGVKQIQIQTNASLIDVQLAQHLREAGLTDAFVAFHSHIPEIQDKLTGLKGSFEKAVTGINNLIAAGINTAINIVITAENYADFSGYVQFVHDNFPGLAHLSMAIVQPHGKARENIALLPRYSEIADSINTGLRLAAKLDMRVDNHYCSLPLCFWDPTDVGDTLEFKESAHLRMKNRGEPVDRRIKMVMQDKFQGPKCADCWIKNFCFGVWSEYIEQFGYDDINPNIHSLKFWG
jgi:MoaA/NifB/PqqE/SkfB family radical SAM enzyme